jgi:hypothetical protein
MALYMPHMIKPKPVTPWIWLLMAWVTLAVMLPHYRQVGVNAISRPGSSDFYKFYISAQRPGKGYSIYWMVPPREKAGDPCHPDTAAADLQPYADAGRMNLGGDSPCLGPNLNPPVFMLLMKPLSGLAYAQAWWVWAAASALCAAISIWLMASTSEQEGVRKATWWTIGFALLMVYYPSIGNHTLAQLGMLLLLLLTAAWHHKRLGNDLLAGMWLGLAVGLKPFLLPMAACLIVTRCWKMLAAVSATVLITVLVGAGLCGWQAYADYLQVAGNVNWTATNWNASWTGLIDRYFIATPDSVWPITRPFARALSFTCAGATFAALLFTVRRHCQKPDDRLAHNALFAMGPAACLLMSPLGWLYYFPLLALPFFICWRWAAPHIQGRAMRMGLLAAMGMQCVPIGILPSPSPMHPANWYGIDAWFNFSLIVNFLVHSVIVNAGRASKQASKQASN